MKTNLDYKKYTFFNLPKILKESDYQELSDLTVEKLKNISGIKSIYLSSGIWIPGISDLDIIIVCDERAKKSGKMLAPWQLSEKAKYIFTHNFWELDEESFKFIRYISPSINLKLLWGKDIPVFEIKKELSQKEYQFIFATVIFDFLINKLLFFPRYINNFQLNVRQLLGEIYSLIYTLDIFNSINFQPIKTDFPERIKKLRENWFISNKEKNLKELVILLEESIDLILEIVVKLNNFVEDHNLLKRKFIFKNRKYYIASDKNWTKDKFINNFLKGHISIKKPFSNRILENFKLVLPESFSYFFTAYINQKGILSDWIRKNLNISSKEISVNPEIIRHIKIINNSAQTSIKYGFSRIPFPFGLLIHKQTLLSRIGDILILSLRKVNNLLS